MARRRALHSCAAAISVSADVSVRGVLKPGALLRQIDSALWISGLGSHFAGNQSDAYCVAQALHIVPFAREAAGLPNLIERVEPDSPHGDPGLCVLTWLSAVGSASADVGAVMASERGGVFAAATRKFVRVGHNGRPANWTPAERGILDELRLRDAHAAHELLHESEVVSLPPIERLAAPADGSMTEPMFHTVVLPHHMGAAGHLDHSVLYEWAYDAHILNDGEPTEDPSFALSSCISYMRAAQLGDTVEVVRIGDDASALLIIRKAGGAVLAAMRSTAHVPENAHRRPSSSSFLPL